MGNALIKNMSGICYDGRRFLRAKVHFLGGRKLFSLPYAWSISGSDSGRTLDCCVCSSLRRESQKTPKQQHALTLAGSR